MSNTNTNIKNNTEDNSSTDKFGIKFNNIQSSLKYFNFEGMDKDKIVEKYEEVVCQREKQIRELAYEIGVINEKLENSYEKIKILEEDNRNLNSKVLKKNTLLEQELTNKDIMFIKLNNLQNENDKLMNKLQSSGIDYSSSNNTTDSSKKGSIWSIFGISGKKEEKKTKEQANVKTNSNTNMNMSIPLVSSKEGESDKSNTKNQEKTNLPISSVTDEGNISNHKKLTNPSNPVNPVVVPSSNTNLINNNNKNSNITSSISAMLTPDVLNSIDLQSNLMGKSNNTASSSGSIQMNNKYPSNRNPLRDPKGGSTNKLSFSSLDKRLASESIDYEPVFK